MSERNPSVNRYLRDKAFDHIDHALGRPLNPLADTYRNYFATSADGADAQAFAASDYWTLGGTGNGMSYFHVTDAGRHALRDHLENHAVNMGKPWRAYVVEFNGYRETIPATSRGQARYRRFLNISDLYPSLKFGQFCRAATVRVVA